MSDPAFDVIAHVIQLSVAPVFLLVAVGSFLNVATQRLARVVDRSRAIEEAFAAANETGDGEELRAKAQAEMMFLDKRISYANASIMVSSASALLVAVIVAVLFIGGLTGFDVAAPVAALFILAMGGVITGLGFFLAEISVATRSLRIQSAVLKRQP